MRQVCFDIEARGFNDQWRVEDGKLLSHPDTIFCIVAIDLDTRKKYVFGDHPLAGFKLSQFKEFLQTVDILIAHNMLNYDLPVLKAMMGIDYEIFYAENSSQAIGMDRVAGKEMRIVDTLILSKLLDPDRFPGHSLAHYGRRLQNYKGDYKPENGWNDPELTLNKEMLDYCIQDVKLNIHVYSELVREAGGQLGWLLPAFNLEQAVAVIIQKQEQYGFKFDIELCNKNIEELTKLMEDIETSVHPQLPPRPLNVGESDYWTPPKNQVNIEQILPPKNQVKKNGYCTKAIENMVEKYGGKIVGKGVIEIFDTTYNLPIELDKVLHEIVTPSAHMRSFVEKRGGKWVDDTIFTIEGVSYCAGQLKEGVPILNTVPTTLPDQETIKALLLSSGWIPTRWKEKDLTINSKKSKLDEEAFAEAVERYVDKTLGSPFEKLRCEHLKVHPDQLKDKLLKHNLEKPLTVLSQPEYYKNDDKELCDNLVALGDKFSYIADVGNWLTYRHRLNACKGFLKQPRLEVDGRLPTPADTLGCNTSRFQHKIVANIPRVSSTYGQPMRDLFTVDDDKLFIGCDADALEARIEGHYALAAEKLYGSNIGSVAYANALVAEKPNDTHTLRAKALDVTRDEAKTIKYGMTYGAQIPKLMKSFGWSKKKATTIFNAFWEDAKPLKIFKDVLIAEWEANGKKFIKGPDGRKLITRSKHSILNVAFQHFGVLCMKRAMVWWDKQITLRGVESNQLIAYHDEADLDVNANEVQLQLYNTKEEAEEAKKTIEANKGLILSDVGHKGDKYFLAYHPAGELAVQSIKFGGEFYNLNVELTSGYIVGKTWAECH